ncbi:PilZ domain-containing protein [Gallaecimonas sp. GXIMD1310]|uniref:PilZ domain-containing protein n=1 Tax=Gallaecimonas sp. GXIMD1310 TaxID=3131926 RepID=UPI0032520B3C
MVIAKERRYFDRIPFSHQVSLCLGKHCWETEVLDLSLRGALVRQPERWPAHIGEACTLHLPLDDNDQTGIDMRCTLVGRHDNRLHLLVEHIDVESVSRLRRLVELNLGQAELLERNLGHLIDSHGTGH